MSAPEEIKSLIGASVERVESGARLVQDAGTTMDDIVAQQNAAAAESLKQQAARLGEQVAVFRLGTVGAPV